MPQILVQDLRKTYRISERDPGVLGALRGLVLAHSWAMRVQM